MIHLALDGLPDWAASEELKTFGLVHMLRHSIRLGPYLPASGRRAELPDEPCLLWGSRTAVDPSRAPEGKNMCLGSVRRGRARSPPMRPAKITGNDWPRPKRSMRSCAGHDRAALAGLEGEDSQPPPLSRHWNLESRQSEPGRRRPVWWKVITFHRNFLFRPPWATPLERPPLTVLHLTGPVFCPVRGPERAQVICSLETGREMKQKKAVRTA